MTQSTIPDADMYQDASESIHTDSSDSESDSTEINRQYVLFHSGYSYHSFNIEIFIFFIIFVCYINIGTIYVQPLALCPPLAYSWNYRHLNKVFIHSFMHTCFDSFHINYLCANGMKSLLPHVL